MFSPIGLTLRTGNFEIDRAFRIAMGDMLGNVIHYKSGLLEKPLPCLSAGLSYPDPWTRDTALNTWSGAGAIIPEVMKNTLLSCLTRGDASAGMGEGCNDVAGSKVPPSVISISGQYWDRVIWAIGAWAFYCQNGDREFLALALEAVRNSLPYLEENEWDGEKQLFRGGACIADGLGAYGDLYSNVKDSGIYQWPEKNPDKRHPKGAGLPVMALSSNCLYAEAYRLAAVMAVELGLEPDPHWEGMRKKSSRESKPTSGMPRAAFSGSTRILGAARGRVRSAWAPASPCFLASPARSNALSLSKTNLSSPTVRRRSGRTFRATPRRMCPSSAALRAARISRRRISCSHNSRISAMDWPVTAAWSGRSRWASMARPC
jgi:hypothetical protein